MPLADPMLAILEDIARRLSGQNISWRVGGSAAAAYHGADLLPDDLDIFAGEADAGRIAELLGGRPPERFRSPQLVSIRTVARIGGITVDAICGLSASRPGLPDPAPLGEPPEILPHQPFRSSASGLPMMGVSALSRLYRALGREDRIAQILAAAPISEALGRPPCLGVDVGGVLCRLHLKEGRLPATPEGGAAALVAMPDVHVVMHTVLKPFFGDRIHIISKAEPAVRPLIAAWLWQSGLAEAIGLVPERVHFTETLAEKAVIARQLGLTHMIDDRFEVLARMPFLQLAVLFADPGLPPPTAPGIAANIRHAGSWPEAAGLVAMDDGGAGDAT
ncbi:hypothetical protein [Tistrella mobilis]|uniref:hypothetical protein n=1 Tax=Tistrella mobilis TaxID=171437 RepID=UPI003558C84C